ncbi:MAG: phospho-sugar glycosidase domain-containing protein [Candidatus Nanopelagicales bacterium]
MAAVRWQPNGNAAEIAATLTERVLSSRMDECDRIVRVRESRPMIGEPSAVALAGLTLSASSPGSGDPRPRGAVTVDNSAYGRYFGEVQLVRTALAGDPLVTVIGQVAAPDLPLLDLLPGGARFILRA